MARLKPCPFRKQNLKSRPFAALRMTNLRWNCSLAAPT
jgi:hypothetical protein